MRKPINDLDEYMIDQGIYVYKVVFNADKKEFTIHTTKENHYFKFTHKETLKLKELEAYILNKKLKEELKINTTKRKVEKI